MLTSFGVFAALLGAVYFVFYFHVIGRPDLIMSVLLDNLNTFYVFAGLMLLGGLALVLHLMPSVLIYMTFTLFKEQGVTEESAFKMSGVLFTSGVVVFFTVGLLWFWADHPGSWLNWLALLLISLLWAGSAALLRWVGKPLSGHDEKNISIVMTFLTALVSFMGVFFSVLIMINSLRYGSSGCSVEFFSVAVGFVFALCTFIPGIAWIAVRDKGLKKQLSMAGAVSLSIIFLFVIMTPDIRSVMVFNTGRIVSLHSDELRQYSLTGSDREIARFRSLWPQGAIDERGLFVGKQLFTIGGAELICPKYLTLNTRAMLNMERGLGADCMLFRSSQATKGSAIIAEVARGSEGE